MQELPGIMQLRPTTMFAELTLPTQWPHPKNQNGSSGSITSVEFKCQPFSWLAHLGQPLLRQKWQAQACCPHIAAAFPP